MGWPSAEGLLLPAGQLLSPPKVEQAPPPTPQKTGDSRLPCSIDFAKVLVLN